MYTDRQTIKKWYYAITQFFNCLHTHGNNWNYNTPLSIGWWFVMISHDLSWSIMINLQILSWKVTNNHQKSRKVTMLNETFWWSLVISFSWFLVIFLFKITVSRSNEQGRICPKKSDAFILWSLLTWWFLVINHDQSWFPNSNWERYNNLLWSIKWGDRYLITFCRNELRQSQKSILRHPGKLFHDFF